MGPIHQLLGEAAEPGGDDRPPVRQGQEHHSARLDLAIGEHRDRAAAEQSCELIVGDEPVFDRQGNIVGGGQRPERREVHVGLADDAQPRLRPRVLRHAGKCLDQQIGTLVWLDLAEQEEGDRSVHQIRRIGDGVHQHAMRQHGDPRCGNAHHPQSRLALGGVHDELVEAIERTAEAPGLERRGWVAVERVGVMDRQHDRGDPPEGFEVKPVQRR